LALRGAGAAGAAPFGPPRGPEGSAPDHQDE